VASPTVVWFRRDLRLADHPALMAGLGEHRDVLPLFVVDPTLMSSSGAPRAAFLHDCLVELDRAMGGALVVRAGDPVDVVPAVAAEIGADTVYVSRDAGPYGRRRDAAVHERLRSAGRRLRGEGSAYAVDAGTVRKADGDPYAVFTPFFRAWSRVGWQPPVDAPRDPDWRTAPSDGIPGPIDTEADLPPAGEPAAWDRWDDFVENGLGCYDETRDLPAASGTSRMSPYLRWGTVHPRQLLADLGPADGPHQRFASELAWREFYADVLFHRPHTAWSNLDERMDAMPVDDDARARERFDVWASGRTGFPIVDAGMRQLLATGWMHNRVRMIVASFLVKDLHLPWQWGARHFMDHLVDGDLASNNHGWQWAAGTGTDAAPYFRVFNPTSQAERYDPEGEYASRWVPELGSPSYPSPMVDHAAERAEALSRYEAARRR
jgi:deoxyribodipyrimidine photo-lyase